MAIEYATKYSSKVDERFTLAAQTAKAVNNDYEWVGVEAIKVFSINTAPLNNYSLEGTSRYGTPENLSNSAQTMLLSQDKSFTFVIDKKAEDDTQGAMQAGQALRREIDEVVIPTVDKYRLGVMVEGAGNTKTAAVTASNAYASLLAGQAALLEAAAPAAGRIAYVSSDFYTFIKSDASFIKSGDVSQNMLVTGSVGTVDGVNIVPVPSSYLPTGVAFILTHPKATVGPVKLESYKIHDNPPGINGKLVEGRIRYDAFVLKNKEGAIYVHKTA